MPRVLWPLHNGRPTVEVELTAAASGLSLTRLLLADTGAGKLNSPFHLLLRDTDCLLCGGLLLGSIKLARAYRGLHPVYRLRVQVPALGFDDYLQAVGISSPPPGLDGNASFPFLSQFTYGNFGLTDHFGLER